MMIDTKAFFLADLIASTPGAQTREEAQKSIKARRKQLLSSSAQIPVTDFGAAEPMPLIDAPDEFAKAFFGRLVEKDTPPRGSKPRLVVVNKIDTLKDDEDPDPPKAA